MKMELTLGLLYAEYTAEEEIKEIKEIILDEDGNEQEVITNETNHISVPCSDEKCSTWVRNDDPCFVDTWSANGDIYCDDCGKMMRYARKKVKQRGEDPAIVDKEYLAQSP